MSAKATAGGSAKSKQNSSLGAARRLGLGVWQRLGAAMSAMGLKAHLVVWPVAAMAVFGLGRFIESVSRNIGDIFVTEAMYPAKTFLTIVTVGYLIWAMREIWIALQTHE